MGQYALLMAVENFQKRARAGGRCAALPAPPGIPSVVLTSGAVYPLGPHFPHGESTKTRHPRRMRLHISHHRGAQRSENVLPAGQLLPRRAIVDISGRTVYPTDHRRRGVDGKFLRMWSEMVMFGASVEIA